jgi:hypothetical protein
MPQVDFPINVNLPSQGGAVDLNNATIGELVGALLPYIFAGAGLLLLLFLVIGGLSLMLSRGDPKAVQSAKDKITGALIGFIIVFASYWIVQIVGRILGIEEITNTFR